MTILNANDVNLKFADSETGQNEQYNVFFVFSNKKNRFLGRLFNNDVINNMIHSVSHNT